MKSETVFAELMALDSKDDRARLLELMVIVEDCQFTEEQSKVLSPRLLGLALEFRDSGDARDAPAVWAAIRTGASMLFPKQIERLLPLLQQGSAIDTSMTALKMVGRIVEGGIKMGLYPV